MDNPSYSIREAEKRALQAKNEEQDSLEVMHAHMREFGVGITTSSPAPGELPETGDNINKRPLNFKPPAPSIKVRKSHCSTPSASLISHDRHPHLALMGCIDNLSKTRTTRDVIGIDHTTNPQGLDSNFDRVEVNVGVPRSRVVDGHATLVKAARPKKMYSSQSSTQSNAGRSYDQYLVASSPGHPLQDEEALGPLSHDQARHPDKRSLNIIDTDAVNSDNVGHTGTGTERTASAMRDESALVDFGSLARNRVSQTQVPPPIPYFPETPAHPSNPFRQTRSQLLPPSQLFGATQFSSAVKLASPTSSRPSPDDFQHNSISPNPIISSPLKSRGLRSTPFANPTSSPQILPGTTSPRGHDGSSSPMLTDPARNPIIPESSIGSPRKRSVPEPMAVYEPMQKSQERRSTSELRSVGASSEEEEDSNDSIARRRKAKSKKEAALKQLTAISFTRPSKTDDVEVPSSHRRKPRGKGKASLAQSDALHSADSQSDPPDTVADSQKQTAGPNPHPLPIDEESTQSDVEEDLIEGPAEDPGLVLPEAQDLPQLPSNAATQRGKLLVTVQPHDGDAVPETSPTEKQPGPQRVNRMSPPALPLPKIQPTAVFQSSPPALNTRPQKSNLETPSVEKSGATGQSTSPLTNPGSTPPQPSSVTPVTDDSVLGGQANVGTTVPNSSPAVAKSNRRQATGTLSKSKLGSTENLRQSTRSRRYSSSTDELSMSGTATPTFEQSLHISHIYTSKSGRSMTKPQQNQRSLGLFEGMAFAISFQSRKPGESNDNYKTRVEFSSTIEKRIKQAGGRILHLGFDELFEALPAKVGPASPVSGPRIESDINLTAAGRKTGFTALIADGHSRKVKYMQALALGLPCIATRWITSCLDKNELVDWTPYLLCAGQSAFLGDAIRSRNLTTYEADTAKLPDIIDQRTKLLEGSKILLVMKKSIEGKKMAYVFLARVLGASLSRVYSIEEARDELKAAEDSGKPFDWVYVDGKSDKVDLFSAAPAGEKRKRKRASTSATAADPPPLKKIRTLSDELVIQSLILGRLIEEGEMEG